MKEKILAFLMANLSGIQKAYLEGIAEHYATTITEENQIETTLNQGVLSFLKHAAELAQKEGDRRATEATKTAITNYEAKFKLKDGKAVQQSTEIQQEGGEIQTNPPKKDEDIPDWAKSLVEANKKLTDKLTVLEQKETLQTKKQKALDALKASKVIPEKFQEKWAGRINIDSETSFEDQVKELETEYTEIHTSIVGENSGKGLPTGNIVKGEVTDQEAQEVIDKL